MLDLENERNSFLTFMNRFILDTVFEKDRPMGNIGASEINQIVGGIIFGQWHILSPVIPRALEWIDYGLETGEPFGEYPTFHWTNLNMAKALGLWLLNSENAAAVWEQALINHLDALATGEVYTKRLIPKLWLDDHMAYCFQAGAYAAGIAKYESFHGEKAFPLKGTPKARDFAYAMCLHARDGRFDPDELRAAGRRMLRSKLKREWLEMGQYYRGAMWLKMVYWHRDPALTPLEVILKAYDDMPEVERPVWVDGDEVATEPVMRGSIH